VTTTTTGDSGPVRITWIGHSTVLLELDGVRLLTDPVLRRRVNVLARVAATPDVAEIGPLDAALVSHLHHDHLDLPSMDLLGRALPVVVAAGGGKFLRKRGFPVTELAVGDGMHIGSVEVRATEAEHRGRRFPWGLDAPPVGYLLTGSQRVYFAGDTDLFGRMSSLAPGLDVALLPVGGWGSRVPAGHLDPQRAAEALRLLRPRVAVPIHWGTYRRIDLAWRGASLRAPADAFAELADKLAPEVDVRIIPVGGSLEVPARLHRDGSAEQAGARA